MILFAKLSQRIIDHPRLNDQKKMILTFNSLSYFRNAEEKDGNDKVAEQLKCSLALAQQYKEKNSQIDWQSSTDDNHAKIDELIDIMSSIMDYQWKSNAARRANASAPNSNASASSTQFFKPSPTQLAYMQQRQAAVVNQQGSAQAPPFNTWKALLEMSLKLSLVIVLYLLLTRENSVDSKPSMRGFNP